MTNQASLFYRAGKLHNSLDISPGCTLKFNENDRNLFILDGSNKIKILSNVTKGGFGQIIELTLSPSDRICDFKVIGQDKVLVLCSNNKLSLHSFNNVSSLLLDEKDFNEGFNQLDFQSISLAVGPNKKYFACLLKGSGGRPDKIKSGEISGDLLFESGTFDCSKAAMGSSGTYASNSIPSLIDLNMDFVSENTHPILLCTDGGNVRKILACKLVNGRVHESDSVPNNKMGFTSKRIGNDLFTIDQFGVISRFQMGGVRRISSSTGIYGPKVISSTSGNLRTRVQPSPVVRQVGTTINSYGNTLTPHSANYVNTTTQPRDYRSSAIISNGQPIRRYSQSKPSVRVNGQPINSISTTNANGVRTYQVGGTRISNGTGRTNTVYTPIETSATNPISITNLNQRYSKENVQPTTKIINGKPVKVYSASNYPYN